MLGEGPAGLDLLKGDIGGVLSRAAAATCAGTTSLIRGCWHICRDDIVLSVLLLPCACLGAVGNFLCCVSFQPAGILLHARKLIAVGDIIFRWPVPHFLLDRGLAVAGIGVVAQK